jgi:phage baseplate assembly protein gpV
MANEFVARNGLIAQNDSIITGSLTVSGSVFVTGSQISVNADTLDFTLIGHATPLVTLDEPNGVQLYDTSGQSVVQVGAYQIIDSSGNLSIRWNDRQLYDSSGATAVVDWNANLLSDNSTGAPSIDWEQRQLLKSDGSSITFDWENGILVVQSGSNTPLLTAEPGNGVNIHDTFGNTAIESDSRLLKDSNASQSLDWNNRYLIKLDGSTAFDWENGILTGSLYGTASYALNGGSVTGGTLSGSFGITIDGGGSAITTGNKGYLTVPYGGTITGWRIISDQSGSCVVDVWKTANAIPTVTNTIAGTEKPTLSSQQLNTNTALTTWTSSVSPGDIFAFNVDSATTVTRVNVSIYITKQ